MRGADHVGGQFPHEVDLLLGEHGHPGLERLGGLRLGVHDPHALAVVPAAHRLEDDGETARPSPTTALAGGPYGPAPLELRGERGHIGRIRHDAVARARDAERVEPRPHHALVLGVHQRLGAGADGDAVRLQGPQVLGGHVLVVEGDHVAAAREVAQSVQVAVVADDDVTHHLGRGILRGVTEELEPDAERDASLVRHTSELTAADHADYRERHDPRVSAHARVADSRPSTGTGGARGARATRRPQEDRACRWLAWRS